MSPDIKRKESGVIFHLTGYGLACCVLPLPVFAFACCVILSVLYDFEQSTATHCRVRNYLPSISAAIGGFTPQRYIWRICIALHCAPRFMLAVMHYNYYRQYQVRTKQALYGFLVQLNCALNVLENACLVGLSYISSTENYKIHENSFIGFMIFSELYMLLSCILFRWSRSTHSMNAMERQSYRWKLSLFLFNISAFAAAGYFFYRHNKYCEPGIYTIFALLEYSLVLSNIAFHGTAVFDFGRGQLVFNHAPVAAKPKNK